VDKRAEIDERAANAASMLRAQQKPVLMLTDMNDRVIISGGAGTGKTLIAMEIARRRAERGARVALLCFNKLVGDTVNRSISESGQPLPNLVSGRAIQVMAEMAGITIPSNPAPEFWEATLPEALESRLTDPDFSAVAQFDYLVLDEAQDILSRPRLWQCVVSFLRGGLSDGKFALFGDFEHQVLNSPDELRKSLAEIPQCVKAALSENCRNYSIVGNTAVQLSGLRSAVYTGFMRTGGSLRNYDIAFYDNDQGQLNQLRIWLREFRDHGYRPSEISVLSFCKPETSAAAKLSPEGFNLSSASSHTKTLFTSVHAFKGMENKVIILTDVRIENADFHRNLFYTGMTRATDTVRVLCSRTSQETLMSWLTGSTA
jgi:hypothetical protein